MTVFGDLAPDGPLDGPTLSRLMHGIGIKPEATRVALHRLRADGWITSHKQGRISAHSLTPKGQKDSIAARPRIYGQPDTEGQSAKLVLMPEPGTDLNPTDFAQVAPRLYVCAQDTPVPDGAMILAPQEFPPWIARDMESDSLRASYAALFSVLEKIEADMNDTGHLSAHDIALLRVMIVHAWRRLALKHPMLPRDAHSPDWRGHACGTLVTKLLDRYPRPSREQLKAT
ncbi:PaaX family transcriptional regulator C-terminal domain-containing protein [Tateyamaria armeniaca]|uniref:PaaX family transcriptional regulator C-terminal domain-containing protein n=1 Tax=Tateyamaria armeniaca TaxID=2518930 RepID=A0ABW8URF7_9RHOB